MTRPFTVALMVTVIGLAACGDDETTPASDAGTASTPAAEGGEMIVIKTRVTVNSVGGRGKVLADSVLGDSPFCPGGTFTDQPPEQGGFDLQKTIKCADGMLEIGFSPGVAKDQRQSGDWQVTGGSGGFEGASGGGHMTVVFEKTGRVGRETFTGTLSQ